MTDESESSYKDRVAAYLVDEYGVENVEKNYYFEDTGRYADFRVNTGLVKLAIEVENDADSIVEGVGQSLLYAAHCRCTVPLVLVPPGHVEQPEVDYLRRTVPILELDV